MIEAHDSAAPETTLPAPRTASRARIWAGMLVLWIGWGSVYAAMATSAETIPPLLATGVRFLIAGSLLGVLGARRPLAPGLATRREWKSATVLGGLCILIGTGGIVVAVRYVASGTVALLAATAPLWVAVIEWVWLRQRAGARAGAGLLVGFAGTALLVTQTGQGSVDIGWAIVVVLCSGAWGLGMVYASRAPQASSASLATGMQMVLGAVMVFVLAALVGELGQIDLGGISTRSLIGWVWMFFIGALAGYGVCMWLLRVTTPSLVATANYVNPIVAVLIGCALLHEPLTGRTLVSGLFVVLGVVLIVTGPTTNTPTLPEH